MATPVADINVHIEPRGNESVPGMPLDPIKANAYIQRIEAIGRGLKGCGGSHQIELHEVNGCVYLAFHLVIHGDISIAEVHRMAEEMETRLRLEFPELGRVVIHTEPAGIISQQERISMGHSVILIVANEPGAGREVEYNEWYTEKHVPMMFQFRGMKKASRYRLSDENKESSNISRSMSLTAKRILKLFPKALSLQPQSKILTKNGKTGDSRENGELPMNSLNPGRG